MAEKELYKKIKTKSYDRRAVDKYQAKFDQICVRLPKGAKQRMEAVNMTPADRVAAIMAELERREQGKNTAPDFI